MLIGENPYVVAEFTMNAFLDAINDRMEELDRDYLTRKELNVVINNITSDLRKKIVRKES